MIFVFNQELRFFLLPSVFAITLHVFTSRWRYTHPWHSTWNLKISHWKRTFVLKTIIPSFHVRFWGCIIGSFFNHCTNITNWCHPNKWLDITKCMLPSISIQHWLDKNTMLPWSSAEVRVRKQTQSTKHNNILESDAFVGFVAFVGVLLRTPYKMDP